MLGASALQFYRSPGSRSRRARTPRRGARRRRQSRRRTEQRPSSPDRPPWRRRCTVALSSRTYRSGNRSASRSARSHPRRPGQCGRGLITSRARCTGKAAVRAEGVADDGGASPTDALPESTPARSSSSSNTLPEPTPARSSSSTSVPSSAANPLGSTRPIGVRFLVVFLERSTRLDSPLRSILRSGEGVFHSSMPCGCDVRQMRGHRINISAHLWDSLVSPQYPHVHGQVLGGAHRRGGLLHGKLLGRDVPVGVALRIANAGRGQGVGWQAPARAECKALAAGAGSSSGNSLIDVPDSATVTSSAGAFLAPLACRRGRIGGCWEESGDLRQQAHTHRLGSEERRRLRRGEDDDLAAAVFGRHDADLHFRLVL